MEELLPNIFKVYRDESSGGWGYSYLVKRQRGNIFLARMAKTASITHEYDAIQAMGGIHRIYITDFHFAGKHVKDVAKTFEADIFCSQIEAPKIRKRGIQSITPFDYNEHDIEADLTVIPTPGHTTGGVCYLLTLNNTRYLFTGDLLYFDTDKWMIGSKKYANVKVSFERLQNLEYDYLVGCGDDALGCPYIALTPDTQQAFFEKLAFDYV